MTDTNTDSKETRMLTMDEELQQLRQQIKDVAYRQASTPEHVAGLLAPGWRGTIGGV